jgi:hypothetical protein
MFWTIIVILYAAAGNALLTQRVRERAHKANRPFGEVRPFEVPSYVLLWPVILLYGFAKRAEKKVYGEGIHHA